VHPSPQCAYNERHSQSEERSKDQWHNCAWGKTSSRASATRIGTPSRRVLSLVVSIDLKSAKSRARLFAVASSIAQSGRGYRGHAVVPVVPLSGGCHHQLRVIVRPNTNR